LRIERFDAHQPIFQSPLLEHREAKSLFRRNRHHHFATDLVVNAVFRTETEELPVSIDAGTRLQRTRLVIKTRVDDPRIAARLVERGLSLLF